MKRKIYGICAASCTTPISYWNSKEAAEMKAMEIMATNIAREIFKASKLFENSGIVAYEMLEETCNLFSKGKLNLATARYHVIPIVTEDEDD